MVPRETWVWFVGVLGFVGALNGGAFLAYRDSHTLESYKQAMTSGRKTFAEGRYEETVNHSRNALIIRPNDAEAITLQKEAQTALAAEEAMAKKAAEEAANQLVADKKAAEETAAKKEAEGLAAKEAAAKKEAEMVAAKEAAAKKEAEAAAAKKEAELAAVKKAAELAAMLARKRLYEVAIQEAREARKAANYDKAIEKANEALKLFPEDVEARQIRDDAKRLAESAKKLEGDVLVALLATNVTKFDDKELGKQMEGLKTKHKGKLLGDTVQIIHPGDKGLRMVGWAEHGSVVGKTFQTTAYKKMLVETFKFIETDIQPRATRKDLPIVLVWISDARPPDAEITAEIVPKAFKGRVRAVYYLTGDKSEDSRAIESWFDGGGGATRPDQLEKVGPWVDDHLAELLKPKR